MSNLAEPPEADARLIPDVCSGEEGGGAEVSETKAAGDQGVAGGEEDLALGSCQFAVSGADAHLAVEAVRLAVLCRRS